MDRQFISKEQHPGIAVDRGCPAKTINNFSLNSGQRTHDTYPFPPLPSDVMYQTQVSENAWEIQVPSEMSFDSFSGSSLLDSIGDSAFDDPDEMLFERFSGPSLFDSIGGSLDDSDEMPITHSYLDMEAKSSHLVHNKDVGNANGPDETYAHYTNDGLRVAIDGVRETVSITDPISFRIPKQGASEYANEPTRLEMTVNEYSSSHSYINVTSETGSEKSDVAWSDRCAVAGEASVTDHDKTDGGVKMCLCCDCKMHWDCVNTNANLVGRALVEKLERIETAHTTACGLPQNDSGSDSNTNSSGESRERKDGSPSQHDVHKQGVSPHTRHFYCNVCSRVFKEKMNWVHHWHKHTADVNFGRLQHDAYGPFESSGGCDTSIDPKASFCKICRMPLVLERGTGEALFADMVDMHSHCVVCLKRYVTPQGLQKHMRIHLREDSSCVPAANPRCIRSKTNYPVIQWMNSSSVPQA